MKTRNLSMNQVNGDYCSSRCVKNGSDNERKIDNQLKVAKLSNLRKSFNFNFVKVKSNSTKDCYKNISSSFQC